MILRFTSILFLAGLLTTGCGSTKKTASAPAAATRALEANHAPEDQQVNATYAYFNAIKEKITGNIDKAAEEYATCLRIDPKNHAAMYELASIYSDQKKYNDALFFIKNAVSLDATNEWYQLLLADTYEKLGKYSEATSVYDKLIKAYPTRPDFLFSKAEALLYQDKPQEAISVYDQLEKQIGMSRELAIQKERLYLKLGKVNDAAAELEKLIATDPSNTENYSLLIDLYQANNLPDKAMAVIQRMKATDPDNPNVMLALAEQYRAEGKKEASFGELKKAFQSPQLIPEIKIRILTSYVPLVQQSSEMMEQALTLSKILSETHPADANSQSVYGDFLGLGKKFPEAREQYRASLKIDKKNLATWQQLLVIESELRDWNAMEKESGDALEYYPDQSVIYLFNGIAKLQNEKTAEAIKSLNSGYKLVVDNDAQLVEFYSNLADAYNKQKNYPESDKYFGKAITLDPNNSYVLNNWAYYLTLRNEQLDKAAEMSKKSNELSTNNPSFLDTYAWVLYKQGKYQEALTWLDKALAAGAKDNGTILEHYGDALYHLNRVDDAVGYWQRAKASGDHSEFIERKITERKIYE